MVFKSARSSSLIFYTDMNDVEFIKKLKCIPQVAKVDICGQHPREHLGLRTLLASDLKI